MRAPKARAKICPKLKDLVTISKDLQRRQFFATKMRSIAEKNEKSETNEKAKPVATENNKESSKIPPGKVKYSMLVLKAVQSTHE